MVTKEHRITFIDIITSSDHTISHYLAKVDLMEDNPTQEKLKELNLQYVNVLPSTGKHQLLQFKDLCISIKATVVNSVVLLYVTVKS